MPKIKRIAKLEEKQLTVDIEVANTHSYQLSNGWVSHNTVSQLVDCASGIHSRFSEYYIRTVRADMKDPLAKLMVDMGFPHEPDLMKPDSVIVFSFPVKSPNGCITNETLSAMEQLEIWKIYQHNWCEHKPSCTIYIKEHEWMDVGAWVYRNFDDISGIAFLPAVSHVYKQAPYQPCTKEEYDKALSLMPKIVDWGKLKEYESDDTSINHKEFACSGNGGSCEIVDLVTHKL